MKDVRSRGRGKGKVEFSDIGFLKRYYVFPEVLVSVVLTVYLFHVSVSLKPIK